MIDDVRRKTALTEFEGCYQAHIHGQQHRISSGWTFTTGALETLKVMLDEPRMPAALDSRQIARVRQSMRMSGYTDAETSAPTIACIYAYIQEALQAPVVKPAWRIRWRHKSSGHSGEEIVTEVAYVNAQVLRLVADGAVVTLDETEVPAE